MGQPCQFIEMKLNRLVFVLVPLGDAGRVVRHGDDQSRLRCQGGEVEVEFPGPHPVAVRATDIALIVRLVAFANRALPVLFHQQSLPPIA